MNTDALIRALAADRGPGRSIGRAIATALAGGFIVAAVLFAAVLFAIELGVRPDIQDAAATPRFLLKAVEMLLLAAGGVALLQRLARPEGSADVRLLLPGLGLLALAIAGELLLVPAGDWVPRLVGSNALVCLVAIPAMAAAPLAALFLALRRAAPARPGLLGAVAGLSAGALAGILYAMHCPDDSPLFVAAWYGTAITATAAVGGLAGRRWLRW